ncbi:MAG: DUF5662 family protein [Eubacteriales bacterium]
MSMKKAIRHLCTITHHRHLVMRSCFRAGIPWQGLLHDLSKYSPVEFSVGAKYYVGDRSPNELERERLGFSYAWMHHKGRNKHHFEYWRDIHPETKQTRPVKMPLRYVAEMFCDRVAACKIYLRGRYTDGAALQYFVRGDAASHMHSETAAQLEAWLRLLQEQGERAVFAALRRQLKADRLCRRAAKQAERRGDAVEST